MPRRNDYELFSKADEEEGAKKIGDPPSFSYRRFSDSEPADPLPLVITSLLPISPKWLQKLNSAPWLTACLSLCAVTQGMIINALVPNSLATLETRFGLSSTQSGLFASMYDIAVCFCLIPVTHFGGKGHKGRWLAIGMLIIAMGSAIITLPQFMSDPYQTTSQISNISDLCDKEGNSSPIPPNNPNHFYYFLLLFGQILNGIGATSIYTLGVTLLDESVSETDSALYLSIFFGSSTFGPVIGFLLGGYCLSKFGDFYRASPGNIGPGSPQWYGAWWIAFLVGSGMAVFAAFLMSLFPRRLPSAPVHESSQSNAIRFSSNWRNLWRSLKSIFLCRVWIWLVVVDTLEGLLSQGVIDFFPKLLQNFFFIASSTASLITGAAAVPSAVIGTILGGFITKKLKLRVNGMVLLAMLGISGCVLFGLGFLVHCDERSVAGINHVYPLTSSIDHPMYFKRNLSSSCNAGCGCKANDTGWDPVCDPVHKLTYAAPCWAGCTTKYQNTSSGVKETFYGNCSCFGGPEPTVPFLAGVCEESCDKKYIFIPIFAFYVLSAFTSSIPIQESELRAVPFNERSLAFGVRWIFLRLLGTIPGPILFGKFVDTACLGKKDDCHLYSNQKISMFVLIFGALMNILILGALGMAWKENKRVVKVEVATEETTPDESSIASSQNTASSTTEPARF